MLNKTLSQSDKKIMKGNPFAGSIIACALMALCCIACFTGATWAWFTSSAAVQTEDIVSAYCEIETVVKDQNGNTVQPDENGKYTFAENVRYTVTLTAKGNASSGFASFTVDGVNYCSIYLNPKEEESVTFDILNYGELSGVTPNWGEIESAETPVVDADTRFINEIDEPVVKLVPVNENSTAMIERGGVVETYNERILDQTREDKLPLPRNVSAVRATEDEYGYATYDEDAKEYDSWYIYGLRVGTRSAALAGDNNDIFDFVKVTNGGRMEILSETGETPRRNVGTGTIIKVYDTKGTPDDNTDDVFVEQFRVVIYGDLTFDGNVNVADSTKIDTELDYRDWSLNNPEKRVPYLFRAADIAMQNNGLNVADSTMFDTILDKQTTREVDFQINGRGVVPAQG